MKRAFLCSLALIGSASVVSAQTVFNFDNGPINTGTPLDQFSGGITAHFSHESIYPYAIWSASVWGFTPPGFSGNSLWPATVYRSDLLISFSTSLTAISLLYAPQELNTSSSCTMRLSAYMGSTFVGRVDYQSQNEGNWPSDTLAFSSAQPFDNVVVHYLSPPPTGGDYGPIFAVDNIQVTPVPEPTTIGAIAFGLAALASRRRKR